MRDDELLLVDVDGVSRELKIRPHIYVKLVRGFAASLSGKMNVLGEAVANNDRDHMRMILHEIKGTAGNLRLQNIIGPEAVLHTAVKAGENVRSLAGYFGILQREVERLQQYVARLPDGAGEENA